MQPQETMAFIKAHLAGIWQCAPDTFDHPENTFLPSASHPFEIVTFGKGAVIRARPDILSWCTAQFAQVEANRILDSDNLFRIEQMLRARGYQLAGEHMRYAYLDAGRTVRKPDGLRYELYKGEHVRQLYVHEGFHNALNYARDVIAIAAYDGDTLAAMAAADDGLHPLWQIGIDTVDAYRGRGLGAYLVKALAEAIVQEGMTPYYTTWAANLASTRLALSCGFLPAWLGYYAEKSES